MSLFSFFKRAPKPQPAANNPEAAPQAAPSTNLTTNNAVEAAKTAWAAPKKGVGRAVPEAAPIVWTVDFSGEDGAGRSLSLAPATGCSVGKTGLLGAGAGLVPRLKNENSDMAGIIACSAGALAGPDSAAQGEI